MKSGHCHIYNLAFFHIYGPRAGHYPQDTGRNDSFNEPLLLIPLGDIILLTQWDSATDLAFCPDGSMLFIRKGRGHVEHVRNRKVSNTQNAVYHVYFLIWVSYWMGHQLVDCGPIAVQKFHSQGLNQTLKTGHSSAIPAFLNINHLLFMFRLKYQIFLWGLLQPVTCILYKLMTKRQPTENGKSFHRL